MLREQSLPALRKLASLGYTLYGTEKTAAFMEENDIPVTLLHYANSGKEPLIDDFITR